MYTSTLRRFPKEIEFLGDSLDQLRRFPALVRQAAGHELFKLQTDEQPTDYKPIPTIGSGVNELRISSAKGQHRIIYVAKFQSRIYVLVVFEKKTQKIPTHIIALAKARFRQILSTERSTQ